MAMRLYTKDEFEAALMKDWNLKPTTEATNTAKFWETSDGHFISVPTMDGDGLYPDYLFNSISDQIKEIKSRS